MVTIILTRRLKRKKEVREILITITRKLRKKERWIDKWTDG